MLSRGCELMSMENDASRSLASLVYTDPKCKLPIISFLKSPRKYVLPPLLNPYAYNHHQQGSAGVGLPTGVKETPVHS